MFDDSPELNVAVKFSVMVLLMDGVKLSAVIVQMGFELTSA